MPKRYRLGAKGNENVLLNSIALTDSPSTQSRVQSGAWPIPYLSSRMNGLLAGSLVFVEANDRAVWGKMSQLPIPEDKTGRRNCLKRTGFRIKQRTTKYRAQHLYAKKKKKTKAGVKKEIQLGVRGLVSKHSENTEAWYRHELELRAIYTSYYQPGYHNLVLSVLLSSFRGFFVFVSGTWASFVCCFCGF